MSTQTQFRIGQAVIVDDLHFGEITEDRIGDGSFYRVEVDTGKEKHEFWTVNADRMEPAFKR